MKLTKNDIYIIVVLGLFAWFVYKFESKSEVHNHYTGVPAVTDSVSKIKPIDVKPNTDPAVKKIQKSADKEYRKQKEKETIITGFEVKPGEVEIQKVDTAGTKTEEIFKTEPDSQISADNKGLQEKKKTKVGKLLQKTGKVVKTGLAAVGVITIIILATK